MEDLPGIKIIKHIASGGYWHKCISCKIIYPYRGNIIYGIQWSTILEDNCDNFIYCNKCYENGDAINHFKKIIEIRLEYAQKTLDFYQTLYDNFPAETK